MEVGDERSPCDWLLPRAGAPESAILGLSPLKCEGLQVVWCSLADVPISSGAVHGHAGASDGVDVSLHAIPSATRAIQEWQAAKRDLLMAYADKFSRSIGHSDLDGDFT